MSNVVTTSADQTPPVELKDPALAAFLAWLIPGAGHLYQGRVAKGLLFMVCILGAFLYGLILGDYKVVYAEWKGEDKRLPYLCQVGVGLPALPALVQSYRVNHNQLPLWGGKMAPPARGELNDWNKELPHRFELGTVYTMIAGLLNILAIYDAWGGPVTTEEDEKKKRLAGESSNPADSPTT